MRRSALLLPLALSLALSSCGGDDPLAADHAQAVTTAQLFAHLADSANAAGADPAIASAYAGMARAVLSAGRLTTVSISVDGAASEWMAAAQEIGYVMPPCPANAVCIAPLPPFRTFVAWKKDDPRRVVQLTSAVEGIAIGAMAPGASVNSTPYVNTATLAYFDGRSAMFLGTGGTQSLAGTAIGGACPSATLGGGGPVPTLPGAACTAATFTAAFNGTVAPPPIPLKNNAATGTHVVAMASQSVAGVTLSLTSATCSTCPFSGYPPLAMPPIDLAQHALLPASLSTQVKDTLVLLTFTVTNNTAQPQLLSFSTSQQAEFVASGSSGAPPVWRWSDGVAFAQLVNIVTVQPGATLTNSASWRAPKGTWLVSARLTSTSHRADIVGFVTVP